MVFDVAPPVVVKRFEYFRNLFDLSFPEKKAQGFSDTIYRLYDRLGPVTPSPRQIKLFINKLGSLYLEGRSGVELPFLALYRLKEGQITAGASELLDANFLESGPSLF